MTTVYLQYIALLPFPYIDPVALSLGPISVRWYGLAYLVGILLAWYLARALVKKDQIWPGDLSPMTNKQTDDLITWIAIGVVLGGRIGYVLFYDLPRTIAHPMSAIEIWNGGMSFHGGLIGTMTAILIFSYRHKISTWSVFDLVSLLVPGGLFFGRLANFINGELWGRVSDVPWAIVFPNGGPFPRHPSQLYEAGLEGILLFCVLWSNGVVIKKLNRRGYVTGLFVSLYAISRITVEFFREPDAQIGYLYGGWLTMGMVLSLPMLLIGLIVFAFARSREL